MIHCRQNVIAKASNWRITMGMARFRQHCDEIGNRQRLPEQYAAIAALALERAQTIERSHDHRSDHYQTRGHVVRHCDGLALVRWVERRKATHPGGQVDEANEKSDGKCSGSG
jgi:hypothetical protein